MTIFPWLALLAGIVCVWQLGRLFDRGSSKRRGVDALSGLPDRWRIDRHFRAVLRRARLSRGRIGLLYLDLDEFKSVNRAHGRDIGDRALRVLAERLRASVRPREFIGRYESDEFLILIDYGRARVRLRELMRALRERESGLRDTADAPMVIEGRAIYVGFSCGVAVSPPGGSPLGRLVDRARLDLERSKGGKRQRSAHALVFAA